MPNKRQQQGVREVRREQHIEVVGPGKLRLVTTTERDIPADPYLIAALEKNGVIPIGGIITRADDGFKSLRRLEYDPTIRQEYKTSGELLEAKASGLITGNEPWYRAEYMRLKQAEHRAASKQRPSRRT